jgi:hypothetical protein
MTYIEAMLTRTDADLLLSALQPLAAPHSTCADHSTDQSANNSATGSATGSATRPAAAPVEPDTRTYTQRLADAIVQMSRRVLATASDSFIPAPLASLPVVITLDELIDRTSIDPRVACDAELSVTVIRTPHSGLNHDALQQALTAISPALGGTKFEVLEQGRDKRLASRWQRRALKARDRCCVYPGCSAPWEWTEAHHIKDWRYGGTTDLDELASLCSRHHHLLHAKGWELVPDGQGGWVVATEPERDMRSAQERSTATGPSVVNASVVNASPVPMALFELSESAPSARNAELAEPTSQPTSQSIITWTSPPTPPSLPTQHQPQRPAIRPPSPPPPHPRR